jgi:hypothetical protein
MEGMKVRMEGKKDRMEEIKDELEGNGVQYKWREQMLQFRK